MSRTESLDRKGERSIEGEQPGGGEGRSYAQGRPIRARVWVAGALGWVLVLYGTLGIVRPITTWLRHHDLLRVFLACVIAAVGALIAADLWRRRPRSRELMAYAISLLFYAAVLADNHLYQAIEERLHLIEYGVLGWLVWRAWQARHGAETVGESILALDAALTFVIVCAVGLIDEGIQHLLPSRVGDWRDVALDAFSGLLIVVSCWLVAHGRRRDELSARPVPPKR